MPITIKCSNGHELFAEVEHIGRKVRCPECKEILVVPDPNPGVRAAVPAHAPAAPAHAPAPPPPLPKPRPRPAPPKPTQALDELEVLDELEEMEPLEELPDEAVELDTLEAVEEGHSGSRRMRNKDRLRWANTGLGFHYAKMLCFLFSFLVLIVAMLLVPLAIGGMAASAANSDRGGMAVAGGLFILVLVMTILTMLSSFVTPVLGFIGSFFCLWLPGKSNARLLMLISFILDAVAIACVLVAIVMAIATGFFRGGAAGDTAAGLVSILQYVAVAGYFAAWVLFMIALRNLAYYLKDEVTGDEAIRMMLFAIIVTITGPIGIAIVILAVWWIPIGGVLLILLALGGWLYGEFKIIMGILNLIGTIRQNIQTRW
jgi:hypothetical protein